MFFLICSIPVPLNEVLIQLLVAAENPSLTFPAGKQFRYHYLNFYVSFYYVNYSLRHNPEIPFCEFWKAFLRILFTYPRQPLFPYLFALPFLMTVDNSWLHFLSFAHKSPEEDHQVLYALDLSPRNTPLDFF